MEMENYSENALCFTLNMFWLFMLLNEDDISILVNDLYEIDFHVPPYFQVTLETNFTIVHIG